MVLQAIFQKKTVYVSNMAWLQEQKPCLYRQLSVHRDSFEARIQVLPSGEPAFFVKKGRRWEPFLDKGRFLNGVIQDSIKQRLKRIEGGNSGFIFFGLDAGTGLDQVLRSTKRHQGVFIIELYPELFRAFISYYDLREMLGSSRVFFFLGPQAVDQAVSFLKSGYQLSIPLTDHVCCRSENLFYYYMSRKRYAQGINELLMLDNCLQQRLTDHYESIKKDNLTDNFSSVSARKLKIVGDLATETRFMQHCMRDCIDGFRMLGHETLLREFNFGYASYLYLNRTLGDFLADIWLRINNFAKDGFDTPEQIVTVSWIQDYLPWLFDPDARPAQKINRYDQILCQTRHFIDDLVKLGLPPERLHHFYFGANTSRYYPMSLSKSDRKKYTSDISFVAHYPDLKSAFEVLDADTIKILSERITAEEAYHPDDFMRFFRQLPYSEKISNLPRYYLLSNVWSAISSASLRIPYLATIADLDLAIYGIGWENDARFSGKSRLSIKNGQEVCKIFNASKINLNMHPTTNNHARVFDIIASGGFLLTKLTSEDKGQGGIGSLFEIGKEIEVFSNKQELRAKIEYYLSHDKERNQIAQRGRQRLLKEHTIEKRMQQLLDIVQAGVCAGDSL